MEDNDKDDNNNKDDNNDKGISALGLDRDLGFSRGHQGHWPHNDDDDEEEDNDEVEDNDKDDKKTRIPHDLIKFAHIRATQTRVEQIHLQSKFSAADN